MTKSVPLILLGLAIVVGGGALLMTSMGGDSPARQQQENSPADIEEGISVEEEGVKRTVRKDAEEEITAEDEDAKQTTKEDGEEAAVSNGSGDGDNGTQPKDDDTSDAEDTATSDNDAGQHITIDITGENYTFSRDEIRVKVGQTVTINFTNVGGFHDFVIDEFGAATARIETGVTDSVTFTADQAGTFAFYCSVGNHREQGMEGTLIVEE